MKVALPFLKSKYEASVRAIANSILGKITSRGREINIEPHYRRSTQTLGEYVTLDWSHRQEINKIRRTIREYANDNTRKRPLNVMMIASPGSGKSHFIKCLAQKMSIEGITAVAYNMATMRSLEDLTQPLESVRNHKIADRLPILFLDEFDSSESNFSILLPLLWDGELHVGHQDLKLGKIVIVLAGSTPQIGEAMKAAKLMQIDQAAQKTGDKLVDLLSRINGGVLEIPSLDAVATNRDRRVDKICLTLSLLQQRFGLLLQLVPWSLLHFVGTTKFRYGVRSLTHLIDLIPYEDAITDQLRHVNLGLPLNSAKELSSSSLSYHLFSEQGVDQIIEGWKEVSSIEVLVRFNTVQQEEIPF